MPLKASNGVLRGRVQQLRAQGKGAATACSGGACSNGELRGRAQQRRSLGWRQQRGAQGAGAAAASSTPGTDGN